MRLDISDLVRLLEYVPKETALDLHQKILGELVSKRYYEISWRSTKYQDELGFREARFKRQEEFIDSLTEEELGAWEALQATYRVLEGPEPLEEDNA